MNCEKKEARTIFTLFKVFNCPCKSATTSETIYIGNNYLKIFYNDFTCSFKGQVEKDIIVDSGKLQDICAVVNEFFDFVIFLWLENSQSITKYFDYFTACFNDGLQIIIFAEY